LTPGQLRRLKVFADMTEEQVSVFLNLVEPLLVRSNRLIVKMGEPGDCMYVLLDGEVRVSQSVEGGETILAKLNTGEFFGELCLFDEGRRSADVMAARDSTLLRISRQAFDTLRQRHPPITALFLHAILKTVAARMRSTDEKYVDSMLLVRFWSRDRTGRSSASGR
jgi:CRP-like cAMP-binding protein